MSRPLPSAADGDSTSPSAARTAPALERPSADRTRRLLVASHPAVLGVNQEVYRELARRGWEVEIVVPSAWRHSYSDAQLTPRALPGLEGALRPTRVAFAGRPQRHVYLARCSKLVRELRPAVGFVEAEPFALAAAQWGLAFGRAGVPFGVQCYENIDRTLPGPVRAIRAGVLARAAFVAARSDTAAQLARDWGARGAVGLAPPAVPAWPGAPIPPGERSFTIGFAGRLVESKGLRDLLAAVRTLEAPVEMTLIGEGELRSELESQPIPGSAVRVLSDLTHDQMPSGYAQLDVRGAAVPHDGHLEGAVRARRSRGAVVRRAGRRLGLGRDPLADRS